MIPNKNIENFSKNKTLCYENGNYFLTQKTLEFVPAPLFLLPELLFPLQKAVI